MQVNFSEILEVLKLNFHFNPMMSPSYLVQVPVFKGVDNGRGGWGALAPLPLFQGNLYKHVYVRGGEIGREIKGEKKIGGREF